MEIRPILTVVRAASVVMVIAAIVVQAITLAEVGRFDPSRYFAFFTIQSNLIGVAALVWVLAVAGRRRSRALESLRGAAAVYLTVTFFVVIFLLGDVDVQLQLVWVDIALHKIFPFVVVADWLLDPPARRLTGRDLVAWLAYPVAWALITLVRGAADGWYPYPFLDPANGGYGEVAITIMAVTVGFFIISAAVMAIGNTRRQPTR